MTFRIWVNIKKSEKGIIFGYFIAGNFPIDNFSENTGHGRTILMVCIRFNRAWELKNPLFEDTKKEKEVVGNLD